MSTVAPAPPVTWPLPTTWEPRPYQLDALDLLQRRNLVLDHGLGAGKTSTALAALEALGAMRVLVLAPSKVIAVWKDEVAENAARDWTVWSGDVPGARGPLKNPTVARRAEALITANKGAIRLRRPFMSVVNYEAANYKPMRNLLLGTDWDVLICDESHKLSGAGAKTSRLTAQIAAKVRARRGRVILATGTFMPHSALSVYGQMRTLDSAVLGTSWTAFKTRYAAWRVLRVTPDGDPIYHKTPRGDLIPDGVRADREPELMERIAPYVHRVSQEELDEQTGLVEAIPQLRTCVLDPATRRAYDAMERDMIARVADGTIVSANAMTNAGKLAQITSGHGRDATTGDVMNLAGAGQLCAKAKLLLDELVDEDPREPIVVFTHFVFDFEQIKLVCARLGRRYGELSGRRTDGLDGKYMAPGIDLLAVQWQAGSEGLNFSRARHEIDYSFDFKLTSFTQAPRRLNRQGQTRHVTRRVLACEDTIDIACFYALKRRQSVNDAVLARLKGRT